MCSHIAVSSDKPLLSTSIAGVPKKIKTINYQKQEFGYIFYLQHVEMKKIILKLLDTCPILSTRLHWTKPRVQWSLVEKLNQKYCRVHTCTCRTFNVYSPRVSLPYIKHKGGHYTSNRSKSTFDTSECSSQNVHSGSHFI